MRPPHTHPKLRNQEQTTTTKTNNWNLLHLPLYIYTLSFFFLTFWPFLSLSLSLYRHPSLFLSLKQSISVKESWFCRANMMARDEWMRAAMTDDMVVVQLLVRLKQSQAASSSSSLKSPPRAVVPLRWGIRQPRSRSATLRCDGTVSRRKDADSTRCSPTTPLSWSGGASPSATADDSTSFHTSLSYAATARSKVLSLSLSLSLTLCFWFSFSVFSFFRPPDLWRVRVFFCLTNIPSTTG